MLLLVLSPSTGLFKHGLSVGKAYISDITDGKERQSVLGLFNACSSLGFIFGPLISGYLADRDESLQLCMLFGAIVFSLNVIFISILIKPIPVARASAAKDLKEMLTMKHFLSSINIVKGVRWWEMTDLIALKFISSFAILMFRSNLTIFLQENYNTDYKTLGKIIAFNGVAAAIAAATCGYISRLYSNQKTQLAHLLIMLSLSLLGVTFAPNLTILIVMIVPLAVASSNLRICTLNMFLSRVSEEEKGEVIGLTYSITSVSRMLSPSVVGVAQEWDSRLAGYMSAGLAGITAIVMVTFSTKVSKPIRSVFLSSVNGMKYKVKLGLNKTN